MTSYTLGWMLRVIFAVAVGTFIGTYTAVKANGHTNAAFTGSICNHDTERVFCAAHNGWLKETWDMELGGGSPADDDQLDEKEDDSNGSVGDE